MIIHRFSRQVFNKCCENLVRKPTTHNCRNFIQLVLEQLKQLKFLVISISSNVLYCDDRRCEKFLEMKRNSCQPASSSSNPPLSTDPPSSANLFNLSLISETQMIVENSYVMDIESIDQSDYNDPRQTIFQNMLN